MVLELIKVGLMLGLYGAGWAVITAELAKRSIANGTSRDRDQAIKWASRVALFWPFILPLLAALGLVVWVAGAVKGQIKNRLPMPEAELNALEREVLADQAKDEAVGQDYRDPGPSREEARRFVQEAQESVYRQARELEQVTVCRRCLCPLVKISAYTYIHSPELGAPAPCSVEHPSETTMSRANWRRAIQAKNPEYQRWVELKSNLGKVKMRAPGVKEPIWVKETAVPIHERSGWRVVEGPYGPEDLAAFEIADEVAELEERWTGHSLTNGPDKIMVLGQGVELHRLDRPRYPETPEQRTHRLLHGAGAWRECRRCLGPESRNWPGGMF